MIRARHIHLAVVTMILMMAPRFYATHIIAATGAAMCYHRVYYAYAYASATAAGDGDIAAIRYMAEEIYYADALH